jgi:hypothetical protein
VKQVPVTIKYVNFMIPPWAHAMVPLKRVILVKRGVKLTRCLLAHELVHVTQAETRPWPLAYFIQWLTTGFSYTNMPLEVEARQNAGHPWYLAWADELIRDMEE